MRIAALVALSALTIPVAHAEMRLVNTTGQALSIDVLSARRQQRDITLAPDGSVSEVLGAPYEDRNANEEMVVIRNAEGKEVFRDRRQTNAVYLINNWGEGVVLTHAGHYTGPNTRYDGVIVVNTTGRKLTYRTENADFTVTEGKGRDPHDTFAGTVTKVRIVGKLGHEQALTLSVDGVATPWTGSATSGGMVLVQRAGDRLKVTTLR